MPAVSAKQQRFMGAELARKRAGKKTQTKMAAMSAKARQNRRSEKVGKYIASQGM